MNSCSDTTIKTSPGDVAFTVMAMIIKKGDNIKIAKIDKKISNNFLEHS
jgi:hypothetical protein